MAAFRRFCRNISVTNPFLVTHHSPRACTLIIPSDRNSDSSAAPIQPHHEASKNTKFHEAREPDRVALLGRERRFADCLLRGSLCSLRLRGESCLDVVQRSEIRTVGIRRTRFARTGTTPQTSHFNVHPVTIFPRLRALHFANPIHPIHWRNSADNSDTLPLTRLQTCRRVISRRPAKSSKVI